LKGPPKHYPKNLDLRFGADPFDPRMHRNSSIREHTPLGLLFEVFLWCRAHDVPPAFAPMLASIEACLQRECSDALTELEKWQ
jgi:hypothetical protein